MLSFGFYNSKGGDRKYDAEQFGAMFNGIITDGVFAHYKNALKVTAGNGNRELVVSSGKAWFNGTWTEVDDNGHSIYLMGSAVETTYFVYLAVDKNSRKNSVAWYSSIMNNIPEKGLYFYLLAQVTIPGGVNKITDAMIADTRGSDLCPYVTGIMETVSFEDLVKRVCGENWQDWLGVYEAGITTGVQNAVRASSEALSEVKSLKAYSVESEAVSYTWAKFEAIATGGGGFEWATDSVHTELADPPMPVYLFRDLSYADLGAGFKPSISLGSPYKSDGEATTKPVPASTQAKVWKEYPYFWEGGGEYGTEVLRYDDLQRVIVTTAGVATDKYRYRVSRLAHLPVTYEPGAYIGTVTADNATAYPRDGYKDGYWYMRFAAKAEDVSFYYPGLSAKNVQDAIIEVVRTGGTGGGSAMSVIEVEELPATGISGVMYVVKKSGDPDAIEYLWLDRWERVGGSGSGQNVTDEQIAKAVADYMAENPVSGAGADYSFLKGKKYYAIGDSIVDYQGTTANPETYTGTDMQGTAHDETVVGYIQAIEKRYGLVCTNFGNAGGTLPGTYGSLATKDYSDVALVTIAYGTNDARTAVELGNVNSTDIATFAGALNNLLRKIYTDNPECRVVVLTPIQRLYASGFGIATPNEKGKYLLDFVDMCKKVAEKRSTACVDMYRTCGINQTNLAYYTREGVHPLNTGYLRMTGAIIPVLDDLFAVEYNPFGTMTNTGGDEQEQPETGGGGDTPDAPPEEDVQGTEVDITDQFTQEGFSIDGWGYQTARTEYQTAKFIPLPNKTYTIITYAPSTATEFRMFGGCWSKEKADGSGFQGNYTNAETAGLIAAPAATSENGFADIDGVTYKKVKIVFTSAPTVTGEKWINIACMDVCVDHVTCHYV